MLMPKKVFVYIAFIFLFFVNSEDATGQTGDAFREQLKRGTVKIVPGGMEYASNSYERMAGQIAALLDKKSEPQTIHVLPRLTRAKSQAPGTLAFPTLRRPA